MNEPWQPEPVSQSADGAESPPSQSTATCPENPQRRGFYRKLIYLLSGVIGAIITLPLVSFVMAPIFRRPREIWRNVHEDLDLFHVGETMLATIENPDPEPWAGVTAASGAWVRRVSETEFVVFSINCRHLGCPVRWVAGAGLFMCPCHGGVYYSDGTVAGGPPPEPLHQMDWQIKDGKLQIKTGPIPITIFSKSLS